MSIVANRIPGIRATLCHDIFTARMGREHNDSNILCMGGRVIEPGLAKEMVRIWLVTPFKGGRHSRRINMIDLVEQKDDSFEAH
jgi:ribose 5-phosphate isomerase B